MVDPSSQKDIEKIAHQLLKSSKAFDRFPTPVSEIISHADLVVDGGIDLSKTERTFFSRFDMSAILAKVRGVLFRKERTILLDLSQKLPRKHFVMLHECGHDILPWQKAVFDFVDDDNNLDVNVREQFEAEANFFASAVLFQLDRFESEIKDLPAAINSGMHLSKKFGSSIHAALRRYAETTKRRCALLVLKKGEERSLVPSYEIRDYFQSPRFTADFGVITWPERLGNSWKFVQDYTWRKMANGVIEVPTVGGSVTFEYDFFNSSYYGFVLLRPVGENKSVKTKFLIKQ